jgi:hypothetical protein
MNKQVEHNNKNASQQLTVAQPVNSLEPLILQEIQKSHESNRVLHESIIYVLRWRPSWISDRHKKQ